MNIISPDIKDKTADEVKNPSMYKVFLLNDDYTTMEFVVEILVSVFNKSVAAATHIMLNVHRQGIGLCGVYIFEVAETKVNIVHRLAAENSFPLKCVIEKD